MSVKTSNECFPCGKKTDILIPLRNKLVCLKCMHLISNIGDFRGNYHVSKSKLNLRPKLNSYFALFLIVYERN